MKFTETPLKGAFVVELEPHADERGFFARSWCAEEFRKKGLQAHLEQCSISFNNKKGILRGLHYQSDPHAETKLVRCTQGAIYDVIVDIRKGSPTFGKWFSVELSAENRKALYVPHGFAHGFQTLIDKSEVYYQMGEPYVANASRGIIWNDASLGIPWPLPNPILSKGDGALPEFLL